MCDHHSTLLALFLHGQLEGRNNHCRDLIKRESPIERISWFPELRQVVRYAAMCLVESLHKAVPDDATVRPSVHEEQHWGASRSLDVELERCISLARGRPKGEPDNSADDEGNSE